MKVKPELNAKLMKSKYTIIIILLLTIIVYASCTEDYVPKPRGYFRIDLPEKAYRQFRSDCPYSFEVPGYSLVIPHNSPSGDRCWYDIVFPQFRASLHLSYKDVQGNITELMEESRKLVYKHTIKADAIQENLIHFRDGAKSGVLYDIEGNAASPLQFFVSDSTDHFLRGSLYFRNNPNADSIAPVLNYIREDIEHLIETLKWE